MVSFAKREGGERGVGGGERERGGMGVVVMVAHPRRARRTHLLERV